MVLARKFHILLAGGATECSGNCQVVEGLAAALPGKPRVTFVCTHGRVFLMSRCCERRSAPSFIVSGTFRFKSRLTKPLTLRTISKPSVRFAERLSSL